MLYQIIFEYYIGQIGGAAVYLQMIVSCWTEFILAMILSVKGLQSFILGLPGIRGIPKYLTSREPSLICGIAPLLVIRSFES